MENNQVLVYLMNLARDNNISILFAPLDPHTPPGTNSKDRRIMMNSNWYKSQQIPFQLAHEICHILNKDDTLSCLYFSPSKYGIEGKANKAAISLLVPFYVNEKSKEQINSLEFMNIFSIPSYLEKVVNDELIGFNN